MIFDDAVRLYTPEFIIEEFLKYEELILKKTHRTEEEFVTIMHQIKDVITVVHKEEYSKFMGIAKSISPDEKDAMYFALALKLGCGIWSNDKALKNQNKVEVIGTRELSERILRS